MPGYVYILKDSRGRLYIGSTNNPKRRIQQHRNKHTQTTKKMLNPQMVLCQTFNTLEEARVVERKIKKLKRKDYIEKIISEGYIRMK